MQKPCAAIALNLIDALTEKAELDLFSAEGALTHPFFRSLEEQEVACHRSVQVGALVRARRHEC